MHPVKDGFRFGRFELDVRAHELRKDGVRLRLQDQPFEVLAVLLEQPGEVLTRDELRRRLWPDGTFVDFEHGLNAAVKRLRAALGDNADRPRFVETLNRRGYRFIGAVDRIEPERPNPGGKLRLAVLPFADVGGTIGDEYFGEGLTEEMITRLGPWCSDRLAVVARTSSTLVQRTAHTPREVGRSLQADVILSGGIRRDGDRVRITARLIETRGETQVWAESYDRHVSDRFLVQSQVAAEIAQSLAMELLLPEARTRRPGTRRSAAHQAFLKGRYHWNKGGAAGVEEAAAFYERAVAVDPDFAAAHASLARAHVAAAEYYLREPRGALEAGRLAATRALDLDPNDSDAHLALAEIRKTVDADLEGAEASYRLAVALNPSNEAAHRLYGLFLAVRGRIAEAALAAQRACDLDPLCLVVNTSAAWVRYLARDYDEAIEWCRHTLDMDPQFAPANRVLAAALLETGRIDDAISVFERAMAVGPDAVSVAWLAHALALRGDTARAVEILKPLERAADGYVSPYHRALAYTALDRTDDAVALLHAAFEARDPALVNLVAEPRFDRLRADARYGALAERLGMRNG